MSSGSAIAEFDIIARYFSDLGARRKDVILGVGDDAALLAPGAGMALGVAAESVAGDSAPPQRLASDLVCRTCARLAALGATPAWATLALSLASVEPDWLARLGAELDRSLRSRNVALVGGDTTRGPTTVTLQLIGLVGASAAHEPAT